MSMKKVIWMLMLCLFICAGAANSSPTLQTKNGILTGAKGVSVAGKLYDVEFAFGTCASIYNGCQRSSMVFQSSVDAVSASSALLKQVFVGVFDENPALTQGCSAFFCVVYTPYSYGEHSAVYHDGDLLNAYAEVGSNGSPYGPHFGIGTGKGVDFSAVWARWQVAAVPEVSPTRMYIAGLLMFFGVTHPKSLSALRPKRGLVRSYLSSPMEWRKTK